MRNSEDAEIERDDNEQIAVSSSEAVPIRTQPGVMTAERAAPLVQKRIT